MNQIGAELPYLWVTRIAAHSGVRHIENVVQARESAGFVQQGNALGTFAHIAVHAADPNVIFSAGGGIRALGVDHQLVCKGVLVQPGCSGQIVRPAFPVTGQAVCRALGKGEIFFGFAWHSVPPFNLVVNKKASGLLSGIPGDRVLHEGDIVSVDVGARYRGFNGDCAGTFPCGKCSDEALRLIRITRQSFFEGIQFARVGYRISDIGHAVQEYAESYGYSLVREYVGHGVGASLHEAPEIPNYGKPGHGPRLQKNMTIAVEPMVNVGGYEVRVLDNGWTVVTADGSLSAHYENSLLVTDGEPEILTFADDI